MENVLKYFVFTSFFNKRSGVFSDHEITFSELNAQHFLIFEKAGETYNLYVSKYANKKSIGNTQPEILELLISDYDKSNPAHRVAVRGYFE